MSGHSRLVPGDYPDDPEVRAGYEEARRAIELGDMVRGLRLDAGLSQEELARRAGMTQSALWTGIPQPCLGRKPLRGRRRLHSLRLAQRQHAGLV
jgi:hypothetical protein